MTIRSKTLPGSSTGIDERAGSASRKNTRRVLILVVAIGIGALGLVAFAAFRFGRSVEHSSTTAAPAAGTVRRVVSGHYVRLDGQEELIYAGMRTPYPDEALSEEAKQRNEQLTLGKALRLEYEKKPRDKDGRLIAYVYVDGTMVNETLVREGLGYVQAARGEKKHKDQLLSAQADARNRKLGVWAQMGPSNEPNYLGNSRDATFHRPSCSRAAEIKPDRLVSFRNKDEAFDQGYAPCRYCLP